MARRQAEVELPTTAQVEAHIKTYIPADIAPMFTELYGYLANLGQADAATEEENEDEAPAPRRAAPAARNGKAPGKAAAGLLDDEDLLNNDDEPAAAPARGRRAAVEEAPARGRRAAAVVEDQEDDEPAPARGRRAAAVEDNDDEPAPARGRRAAPVQDEEENEPEAEAVTFADLGTEKATVKSYIAAYKDYTTKAIKEEIQTNCCDIALKGTDHTALAKKAAHVYAACDVLLAKSQKALDKLAKELGVEIDYTGARSEKTKLQRAAGTLVEAALESYED